MIKHVILVQFCMIMSAKPAFENKQVTLLKYQLPITSIHLLLHTIQWWVQLSQRTQGNHSHEQTALQEEFLSFFSPVYTGIRGKRDLN